jgi:hypothetical protein
VEGLGVRKKVDLLTADLNWGGEMFSGAARWDGKAAGVG